MNGSFWTSSLSLTASICRRSRTAAVEAMVVLVMQLQPFLINLKEKKKDLSFLLYIYIASCKTRDSTHREVMNDEGRDIYRGKAV